MINLDIKRKGNTKSTLDIHPYFGKFDPAIPEILIRHYSHERSTIIDPFCGSGTSLHEAVYLKRNITGIDANPLGCLITVAKICGIDERDKQELLNLSNSVSEHMVSKTTQLELPIFNNSTLDHVEIAPVPKMPRVNNFNHWFMPNATYELQLIKGLIVKSSLSDRARILALTAFSSIVTRASNQKSESKYCRTVKPDDEGRVIKLFQSSLKNIASKASEFTHHLSKLGIKPKIESCGWPTSEVLIKYVCSQEEDFTARIVVGDSRKVELTELNADLLVTSPPYLYSWDYGLYHKFRMYWLDLDLDQFEEREIGRHLRRKNDDIERYEEDMGLFFGSMSKLLKNEAICILVNSNSVIKGSFVDSNKILERLAHSSGFETIQIADTIDILGPHTGRHVSLELEGEVNLGNFVSRKKETILIFKKKNPTM